MRTEILIGKKRNLLFTIVALWFFFSSAMTNGAVRPLDKSDLSKITGVCTATCTKYVGPLMCCFCTAGGGEGWNECIIFKYIYVCESAESGSCTDSNKYAISFGTVWAKREIALGRRCGGAWFCSVTNVKGKEYIGQNYCWCAYYGCN